MTNPVLLDFDGDTGIARLAFNRPEALNAADVALARATRDAAHVLAQTEGLRCVVLTGTGRAFMAGGDVSSIAGSPNQSRVSVNTLLDALNPAILTLRELNAPILAGVRGVAAGAGLSLALAADLILASEDARFMLAYDRIGAAPDCGGSWFLARKVGLARAAELMMLSRTLSASDARDWGLVAEVAPPEEFDAALDRCKTASRRP